MASTNDGAATAGSWLDPEMIITYAMCALALAPAIIGLLITHL